MIVLDTTVLVYGVGDEHAFREPCRRLLAAVADGRLVATTTVEVLQEFTHVRARRRGRADAARTGRDYLDLLSPLLPLTESDLQQGWVLFDHGTRLGAFDAVLAAAAARAGCSHLVSADAAFAETPTPHVVPDAAGVDGLLTATDV